MCIRDRVDLILEMPEADQNEAMAIINRLGDSQIMQLYADDPAPSDEDVYKRQTGDGAPLADRSDRGAGHRALPVG